MDMGSPLRISQLRNVFKRILSNSQNPTSYGGGQMDMVNLDLLKMHGLPWYKVNSNFKQIHDMGKGSNLFFLKN